MAPSGRKSGKTPITNKLSGKHLSVSHWQIELGKEELKNLADGNTELVEWNKAKRKFKL